MPRRSYSRSRSRSRDRYYRDRDRDRDVYRGGDRDRRDRDRDRDDDVARIHVADLTDSVSKSELEKAFAKFGELEEVWMAKNPPCFAFVVYRVRAHAEQAVKEMDNRTLGSSRIRVTWAKPRTKGRRRRWDPNMRCYQCGQKGHFSRDCDGGSSSRRRDRYSR